MARILKQHASWSSTPFEAIGPRWTESQSIAATCLLLSYGPRPFYMDRDRGPCTDPAPSSTLADRRLPLRPSSSPATPVQTAAVPEATCLASGAVPGRSHSQPSSPLPATTHLRSHLRSPSSASPSSIVPISGVALRPPQHRGPTSSSLPTGEFPAPFRHEPPIFTGSSPRSIHHRLSQPSSATCLASGAVSGDTSAAHRRLSPLPHLRAHAPFRCLLPPPASPPAPSLPHFIFSGELPAPPLRLNHRRARFLHCFRPPPSSPASTQKLQHTMARPRALFPTSGDHRSPHRQALPPFLSSFTSLHHFLHRTTITLHRPAPISMLLFIISPTGSLSPLSPTR